jgi:hypothetical protein
VVGATASTAFGQVANSIVIVAELLSVVLRRSECMTTHLSLFLKIESVDLLQFALLKPSSISFSLETAT